MMEKILAIILISTLAALVLAGGVMAMGSQSGHYPDMTGLMNQHRAPGQSEHGGHGPCGVMHKYQWKNKSHTYQAQHRNVNRECVKDRPVMIAGTLEKVYPNGWIKVSNVTDSYTVRVSGWWVDLSTGERIWFIELIEKLSPGLQITIYGYSSEYCPNILAYKIAYNGVMYARSILTK